MGVVGKAPPPKPDSLSTYETWRRFHFQPIVEGALLDQPYVFMLEMETVGQVYEMMEAITLAALSQK